MNKSLFLLTTLCITIALAGCSREPNQQELQTLYEQKVQSTNQLAAKIMQEKASQIIQVKSFEKIDCTRVKKSKDYDCRSNIVVSLPFLGEQKNTISQRVAKTENGWAIVD